MADSSMAATAAPAWLFARPPGSATALFCAGLALLVSGCAGTNAIPVATSKHVEYAGRNGQATSLATLNLGRKLYIRRCSACHNLKRPESLEAADWPEMVQRMASNAEINPDQQRAITQYLVAVAAAAQDTSTAVPTAPRIGITPAESPITKPITK